MKPGGPIHGPQSARMAVRPATRSAAERANDSALEYAILGARIWAVLAAVGFIVADLAALWTLDWRWGASAALALVNTGLAGWWGWWIKGNEEWRHG